MNPTCDGIADFAGLDIAGLETGRLVPATPAAAVPQPRCCEVCLLASIEGFALVKVQVKFVNFTSPLDPLREITYHIGSHSVTCHPAEVTFPPLPQPKLVLD